MPALTSFNTAMFKVAILDGDEAATNIPLTGATTDDVLLMVGHQDGTSGLFLGDLTAETSITSDGNLQTASTSTDGNVLVVIWLDLSQAEQ